MKIIIDECLPKKLKMELPGQQASPTYELLALTVLDKLGLLLNDFLTARSLAILISIVL